MADYVIIGAGVVGLTIALELKQRRPAATVIVLEKERRPGLHSSGRNSGVLHSGIYYPAGSLKARLCGEGAVAMAAYCERTGLPVKRLGKVLVPVREADGPQLAILEERGAANGVSVERLDAAALNELEPEARSATGEALFVPMTAVVDSALVMDRLVTDAVNAGIELRCDGTLDGVDVASGRLGWSGERVRFGHVVNSAGLHADRVAHLFGQGERYTMLPFKGIYWRLDPASGIRINHLVYPVPDLRVPFLGIHTTTAINGNVYIGPTAVPAFGRENYRGFQGIGFREAAGITRELLHMFVSGHDGFRRLARQEGPRYLKSRFAEAARGLLPRLRAGDLLPCDKIGIRAQLFDRRERRLVNDFLIERGANSTHVLNAVSPAFTSAFPLARFVCDTVLKA
jgi:L-2-hydroxyglutarate oxidase LhgO